MKEMCVDKNHLIQRIEQIDKCFNQNKSEECAYLITPPTDVLAPLSYLEYFLVKSHCYIHDLDETTDARDPVSCDEKKELLHILEVFRQDLLYGSQEWLFEDHPFGTPVFGWLKEALKKKEAGKEENEAFQTDYFPYWVQTYVARLGYAHEKKEERLKFINRYIQKHLHYHNCSYSYYLNLLSDPTKQPTEDTLELLHSIAKTFSCNDSEILIQRHIQWYTSEMLSKRLAQEEFR